MWVVVSGAVRIYQGLCFTSGLLGTYVRHTCRTPTERTKHGGRSYDTTAIEFELGTWLSLEALPRSSGDSGRGWVSSCSCSSSLPSGDWGRLGCSRDVRFRIICVNCVSGRKKRQMSSTDPRRIIICSRLSKENNKDRGSIDTYPCSNTSNQSQTVASHEILIPRLATRALRTVRDLQARQMRLRNAVARRRAGKSAASRKVKAVTCAAGRTVRPAVLPELTQLLAQFLTSRRPVVSDTVAQFTHVTLDLQLILLEPRDIELLSRSAPLELTSNVFVVVTDNPARFERSVLLILKFGATYFVIIPVVLTPSVRWVGKNFPWALIGA